MIRGHRVDNIPTIESELTPKQIKEMNKICEPLIVTKDEIDKLGKNNEIIYASSQNGDDTDGNT